MSYYLWGGKIKKKIIIITLCSIIGLIFFDFIVALLFNNSPIIKIRDYYNGGSMVYKDKGIFTNTYKCSDGKTKTVLKTTKYSCPINDIEKDKKETIAITKVLLIKMKLQFITKYYL